MSVCRFSAWSVLPRSLDPRTLGPCRLCRATPDVMATPSLHRLMAVLTAAGASSRAHALPPSWEPSRGDFPKAVGERPEPETSGILEDRRANCLIGRRWNSWFMRIWRRGPN